MDTHTDNSPYIVMEYLDGQDLQKTARQPPPMSLERKVAIIVQVLAGLAHAHKAGLVHRDIKPANIFIIKEDGSVKITDFGVVRDPTASITGTGNIVGTADYMSPEQVKGARGVDGRSDLFSVGCMLYELVTGRRPFHADNLMAIFYKITHEEANFDLVPAGPEYSTLLPILMKALAKESEQRYQTAFEFAVDLREWLRAHATTASSQHVLESLADLEAPTHPPAAMTEAPGVTVVPEASDAGATVDLGTGRRPGPPARGSVAPTRVGSRTAVDSGVGPTIRPGPTRVMPPPSAARPAPRPRPVARASRLPWVILAMVVTAVGVGAGYVYWQRQQAEPKPPVTQAVAPPTTLAPPPMTVATPTPPPVTAAPQPRFGEAAGKAAAQVREAQAAFSAGSYDRAAAAAQKALLEDPQNRGAQEVLDRSLRGRDALARLQSAEAALARGDLAAAESEAEAARQRAPWYPSIPDFFSRLNDAKMRAQREAEQKAQSAQSAHAAQINNLLNQATNAMQAKQYEAAIAAYNQVLAIEPGNAAAQNGKVTAIGLKAQADAAASAGSHTGGGVRTLIAGATKAESADTRGGLEGFEPSAGVNVKRGSQGAELPGKIEFETSPAPPFAPKPGDRYRVAVYFRNEGAQPIPIASMATAFIVDGKAQRGTVPPAVSTVAPHDKALIYQMPEQVWKEGTTAWAFEVVVSTSSHETYRNALTWK
jgi:tetratricopeptide (TPR) repeat protein